ncbi:hypothetical protein roselon_02598 [Roseibacterium elongatum DSM 19469]|uniref:AsmA-like C-terminal domain-containing protein n=1 Tax=Roseicyclus elongatus DSM 19469 TaxID=1294273 RepID=W8S7N4_9RHOB|nr:hypothetical protein [Roseibacterium elongatum]AHM04916.1 hypothetical protein roselon_02598 [Roseibacterium elongatum DSM 19469]
MSEDPSPRAGAGARRRVGGRWRLAALLLLAVLPLLLALGAGGLWWRLTQAPLSLPAGLQARIEAHLDAAMQANRITMGDMALALPDGGRAPAIEFRDVVMLDHDGVERAAFPALQVRVAPGPLLRGQVRPRDITVRGPGLHLTRGADGRFDVDFMGAGRGAAERPLTETMARLDTMFAAPAFAQLRAISATDVTLNMEDETTGPVLRVQQANATLTRNAEGLELSVTGRLQGLRDATVAMEFSRRSGVGETGIALRFDNLGARDLAAIDPALAWLGPMRAPISGGLMARLADDGTVSDFGGTLSIGAGEIGLGPETDPVGFDGIEAVLTYDAQQRRLAFGQLSLAAQQLSFEATGHADVSARGDTFVGQFRLTRILAAPGDLYEEPLALGGGGGGPAPDPSARDAA